MWSSCRVKKCGWLMKQSNKTKTWARRWFILSDNGLLTYHRSAADWSGDGRTTIDLAQCTAVQDRVAFGAKGLAVDWPSGVGKECCFVVSTRGKTLFLCTNIKDECSAWLVTLQHAMLKAAADRAERRANSTEKDGNNLEPVVRERNQSFISTSGIDNKIDKIRRRFSSVSRQSGSNRTTEQENSLDAASDVSEGDSLSVYSSNSAGNILDDDARSFTSFRSSASASTMQSNHMSSLSVPGVRSSAKDDIFVSWQNSKLTYGLSKNRLPPQVGQDVQDTLQPLLRSIGSINAVTGQTYTFLCNFGEVYKAVSWHLTGAGKQAAAEKEKLGTIIHEKYLVPLSQCIIALCEDNDQKAAFVQRTWKRMIEFQCRQSPFQDSGCHTADCWLDSGVLHVAVLAQYFGELPFQPLPFSIPEVNGTNQPNLMPSVDSGVASSGDYLSRTSSHEKTLSTAEDIIPECLKEDIKRSANLMQATLQVISTTTKVPFTFECEFGPLSKIVNSSLHGRLANVVYNEYLMAASANIVDYCDDEACREEFVRNVHSRRIVLVVDDEEQLVKTWGYLVPSSPRKDDQDGHLISNGYRGSSDTLDDDTNPHGGQVICRDGVLYLTVPLEVFAKEEFNPSIDVFEARKPKDECSRLNSYVSSYSSSENLPEEVKTNIMESARILQKYLDVASRTLKLELVLECNFDQIYQELQEAGAVADDCNKMATTIFRSYVAVLCRGLVKYVEEVVERTSLLERQIYNHKISFQFVTERRMAALMHCPQQHTLGGGVEKHKEGSILPSHTFLHRGVVRIACLPAYFGKCNYNVNIERLPQVPDNIRVKSTPSRSD